MQIKHLSPPEGMLRTQKTNALVPIKGTLFARKATNLFFGFVGFGVWWLDESFRNKSRETNLKQGLQRDMKLLAMF